MRQDIVLLRWRADMAPVLGLKAGYHCGYETSMTGRAWPGSYRATATARSCGTITGTAAVRSVTRQTR
jgi:hypothetical protein